MFNTQFQDKEQSADGDENASPEDERPQFEGNKIRVNPVHENADGYRTGADTRKIKVNSYLPPPLVLRFYPLEV